MSNSSGTSSGEGILEQIWDLRDRRVDEWPLMNSPLPTLALCGLYLYTVKFLGPWFMKDRKPYDLKNTIIVYNFIQVAFSAWLFIKIYLAGWGTTYRYWRGVNPFFRVLFMSASEWLRGCINARYRRRVAHIPLILIHPMP